MKSLPPGDIGAATGVTTSDSPTQWIGMVSVLVGASSSLSVFVFTVAVTVADDGAHTFPASNDNVHPIHISRDVLSMFSLRVMFATKGAGAAHTKVDGSRVSGLPSQS